MTSVDDLASLVDKSNVRDALDTPVVGSGAAASLVVLNTGPSLGLDVVLDGGNVLVEGETDEADLAFPVLVLGKHLLVMGHGFLAGRAPGGPEINHHDFTVVLDVSIGIIELLNTLDGGETSIF